LDCCAYITLVPEVPLDLDEVVTNLRYEWAEGQRYAIIVVAEGVRMRLHMPS
jgi:6-phosphofructokinase